MRFAIRYRCAYGYEQSVSDQHNAVRVQPAETATQRVDSYELNVTPRARQFNYRDYFGTEVSEFNVWESHDRLLIEARARVTTSTPSPPPETGFHPLGVPDYRESVEEYLVLDRDETANGRVDGLAQQLSAESPLGLLLAVCELIPDRFEYRQDVTYVGSTVDDLLDAGGGVCQDFVHLGLLLLRRRGVAARYVSGYLFAAPEDGGEDSVEVDTHAWLEALLPGAGPNGAHAWVGADPTNRGLTGEQHVKIGHGRHYADVPPVKGVYRGAPNSELDVSVKMSRLQG
ncbi:MAG TPA: transglutaminase family protein [Thermoleophilaceae bacterium]